ncbi:protein smg8-like protein, partial [Dinothrombium tinctorium]
HSIEYISQCALGLRKDRVCIVSVVGKSSLGANACKTALVDDVLGRNVFRGLFCQEKDVKNDLGFLQICTDITYNVSRCLLLLFLISHIVIIVNPSLQFDLNYLQIFRHLEATRLKLQPYITDILRNVHGLSNDWISFGRLCSPRVLFVFENYEKNNETIVKNKRNYEKYLEDQIYRFLRKSRIITNICSNSLFAICNQTDFVFIATKDATIRDAQSFFLDLLVKYCNSEPFEEEKEDERNFYSFIWAHISVALSRGFDDNVGRHAVVPVFELPTVKDFFNVLQKLKEFFYKPVEEMSKEMATVFNQWRSSLDADTRFSEARCAKGLPIAMSVYQDSLPTHYTSDFHERKVAMALQMFTLHARGPALFDYARQLREECDRFWQNGHQMCEVLSLTGNNCINPIHITKSEDAATGEVVEDSIANTNQLPSMPHCSGVKLTSACDCGRRQANREDPFTVKAANYDFYMLMRSKCSCGHLERVEFPIFQPSTTDVKPANTLTVENSLMTQSEQEYESQPDIRNSFTNLSQSSVGGVEAVAESVDTLKRSEILSKEKEVQEQPVEVSKAASSKDEETKSECSSDEEGDEDESDDDTENGGGDRERDIQLVIRESISSRLNTYVNQSSTTHYLPGMLHSMSPSGLLPKFSSWSLVCLGPSSLYSHNMGVQDQPGFISGTNFLLPWDVTVKLEHSGHLPPLWEGKRPPGIKNKKTLKDGTQFTVKIFIGTEYECPRGHRFMCSAPDTILKANLGIVKENANKIASNDMPLYFPCVCSRTGKQLIAQLMRIHIVTPKAPVHVTLDPKVQPGPPPCPIFSPGLPEPVRLSQSAYWILRLPFVYEGDHGVYYPPKDRLDSCRLLRGIYGIADYISKPKVK